MVQSGGIGINVCFTGKKGVGMLKNLVRIVLVGAVTTALSACLPDSDLGQQSVKRTQTRTAQATGLARSLSVAASQTADAFIRANAANFAGMGTQTVNLNALAGVALGPAANVVAAGYCGSGSGGDLDQSLVVWLTPTDNNNRFYPAALGEGSTGAVMSKLSEISDPTSIGVADGGNVRMGNGANMDLGSCATAFNIPVGAPVMVFANLQSPINMTLASTRTETRTVACPAGQTGTITEQQIWTVSSAGAESLSQPWQVIANLCTAQVATVAAPAAIGTPGSTGNMDMLGSLGGIINGIASGDLKNALKDMNEKTCVQSQVANLTGQGDRIDYNTCLADPGQIEQPINDLVLEKLEPSLWAYMGGPVTTSTRVLDNVPININNIPGVPASQYLSGHITSQPWYGRPLATTRADAAPPCVEGACYRRELQQWKVTYPDGTFKIVELRGLWEGEQLAASRVQTIVFSMDEYAPNWRAMGVDPANLTVQEPGGAKYTRIVNVDGWKPMPPASDKVTPNDPTYGQWSDAEIGGIWKERVREDYLCHAEGIMGNLYKERTHKLTGYRTVETTAWTTVTVQCHGVCGEDNGLRVADTPTRLCKVGNSSGFRETSTPTNTACECRVNNGGAIDTITVDTPADCPSPGVLINPRCGPNSEPDVTYNWTCLGTTGNPAGNNASCSAIKATTTDGVCGPANRTKVQTAPAGAALCARGQPTVVQDAGAAYNWGCQGSGNPAGRTDSCTAEKITFRWVSAPWGNCSKNCGGGTQTRSVVCKGSNDVTYADTRCAAVGAKPAVSMECNTHACPDYARCGAANGTPTAIQPALGLCDVGNAGTVSLANGSWSWNCTHNASNTVANCGAPNSGGPSCGCSNEQALEERPTRDLCVTGTPSAVAGNGPWSWTCNLGSQVANCATTGAGGGTPGVCGSANGTSSASAPSSNLCGNGGVASWTDILANDNTYNWTCPGTGGGSTASCFANKTVAVAGSCGSANGTTVASAPSSNLCNQGTASSVSGNGPWNWTCSGSNGGGNASCSANLQQTSVTCAGGWSSQRTLTFDGGTPQAAIQWANNYGVCATATTKSAGTYGITHSCAEVSGLLGYTRACQQAVNGSCGSANGGSSASAPTANLCGNGATASWSDQTGTDGTFNWSCPGTNGGSAASCSSTKTTVSVCMSCDAGSQNRGMNWASQDCSGNLYYWAGGQGLQCGGQGRCGNVTSQAATYCVPPSCGSANGTTVTSQPVGGVLCSVNSSAVFSDANGNDGTYNWTCRGGLNNTSVSCSANKGASGGGSGTAGDPFYTASCNAQNNAGRYSNIHGQWRYVCNCSEFNSWVNAGRNPQLQCSI